MEIILDELIQYTQSKITISCLEYDIKNLGIVNNHYLIVKYKLNIIESAIIYFIPENKLEHEIVLNDDLILGYLPSLETKQYDVYLFEKNFNYKKIVEIIHNIRTNLLLNCSNCFRKILTLNLNNTLYYFNCYTIYVK